MSAARILAFIGLLVPVFVTAQLSGTFSAGSVNDDFPTVQAAIDSIELVGVSDSVTIAISPGSYGTIEISGVNLGAGELVTLTAASGNAADVSFVRGVITGCEYIKFDAVSFLMPPQTTLNPLVDISASRNIFFVNCTIFDSYTSDPNWGGYAPVRIHCSGGGLRQIYFDSCVIYSLDGILANGSNQWTVYSTGNFGRFYFTDCSIHGTLRLDDSNGYRHFKRCNMNIDRTFGNSTLDSCELIFYPINGVPANVSLGATLLNSTVSGADKVYLSSLEVNNTQFNCDVQVSTSSNSSFRNSRFMGTFNSHISSVQIGLTYNSLIESNIFYDEAYIIGNSGPTYIADNFFLDDLRLGTVDAEYELYNNNFSETSTLIATQGSGMRGSLINNNIAEINIGSLGAPNLTLSNNNYMSTSNQALHHATYDDMPRFYDPWYVSPTDLHIQNPSLFSCGIPLADFFMEKDLDSNIRHPSPSLGADETCLSSPLPDTIRTLCGENYALKYCNGTTQGFYWQNAQFTSVQLPVGAVVTMDSIRKFFLVDSFGVVLDSVVLAPESLTSQYRQLWGFCGNTYNISTPTYQSGTVTWSPGHLVSDSTAAYTQVTSDTSVLLIATLDMGSCGIRYDSLQFNMVRTSYASLFVDSAHCLEYFFHLYSFCYDSIIWNISDGTSYSDLNELSHEFQSPGYYEVTAQVWVDGIAASDTISGYFSCVGLEEIEEKLVHLYPNPVSSELHVSAEPYLVHAPYEVYDVLGKTILRGTLTATTTAIPVDNLPDGVYLFTIRGKSYRFRVASEN